METDFTIVWAITNHEQLFAVLENALETDTRKMILYFAEKGLDQSELSEKVGVGQSSISRNVNKLKDMGLIKDVENGTGYEVTLDFFRHPLIKHLWNEKVLKEEES